MKNWHKIIPFTHSYLEHWSICQWRGVWFCLFLSFLFDLRRISVCFFYTSSEDADQTPQFVVSDLSLDYLPVSFYVILSIYGLNK